MSAPALRRLFSNSPNLSSHNPHGAPSTHNPPQSDRLRNPHPNPPKPVEVARPVEPDDLGPSSTSLSESPQDPNTWVDGVSDSLKKADAYEPKEPEHYTIVESAGPTSLGDPKPAASVDLGGKGKIVTPSSHEIPEPSPPGEELEEIGANAARSQGRSQKEGSKEEQGHVEYINVLGSPENIKTMDHQGKQNEEVAEEMHNKGP